MCICLRATSTPTHWNLNLGCTGDFKIQHLQKKRCECDVNERKMPSSYSFTYRRLTGGKVVNRGKDLPGGSVDLIVTAMEDQVHFRRNPAEERRYIFCSGNVESGALSALAQRRGHMGPGDLKWHSIKMTRREEDHFSDCRRLII